MNYKMKVIVAFIALWLSIGNSHMAPANNSLPGNMQTFVTYKYIDPMSGLAAFSLLIPKGWKVQGEIKWSPNPALPTQSRFRFYNPGGSEEFNLYPTRTYFWTNNRMFLSSNPPGSLRFGSLVAEPISLQRAFASVVIPDTNINMGDLKIISEKEVPELAMLAKGEPVQGVQASAQGGKIRIIYREKGKQIEDEIYAAVSQFIINLPGSGYSGSYFINYWYIDNVFSFKSEQGKLDTQTKLFQTMIYSLKVNPQWYAKVANVKEILAQQNMQQMKTIGRIGDMVARAASRMREDQQRGWERRQQVQDKIAQNFSDYVRGVEKYLDPRAGKEVELPAGYGNAWSNNLGEYIVTESQSFNPNVGSNLHWEQLTPAR